MPLVAFQYYLIPYQWSYLQSEHETLKNSGLISPNNSEYFYVSIYIYVLAEIPVIHWVVKDPSKIVL